MTSGQIYENADLISSRGPNEIHRGTCATVRWCGWRLLAGLSLHLFSDNLYPRTLALAVTLLHEILSCTLTCEFTVLYGVFYSPGHGP